MFISLQELELHPVEFDVEIPAGEIKYDSSIDQSTALKARGTARLLNTTLGEIRVEGRLKVAVGGTCDRCTEAAKYDVDNQFDLLYMPADSESEGGEKAIEESGSEIGYYEGSGLELNDILREVVLLALPMQLVCREDCEGICPVCGQNKNQADCGCQPELADDRWSKLRTFRAELGSDN